MTILIILGIVLVACFGGVLAFGAPYLPTLKPQIKQAIQLAELKPGQTLLELGCGDGRVLRAAACQGINVVGYELNPLLALLAWLRTRRYRKHVTIVWGDFWRQEWPPAEAIFVFLLPRYMSRLDKAIVRYRQRPVRLISFAFKIPGKRPALQQNGLLVYDYK